MRAPFIIAMSLMLAGCQAVGGYPPPVMSRVDALASVSTDSAVRAEETYQSENDPAKRRLARDRIVRARMFVIDVNYHDFAQNLNTEQ